MMHVICTPSWILDRLVAGPRCVQGTWIEVHILVLVLVHGEHVRMLAPKTAAVI